MRMKFCGACEVGGAVGGALPAGDLDDDGLFGGGLEREGPG